MGFAGTLGSAKTKLYWEGAKAYWEYVKLMNSLTHQYEEIGNSYQGTVFHPIEVTVEDAQLRMAHADLAAAGDHLLDLADVVGVPDAQPEGDDREHQRGEDDGQRAV